MRIIAWRNLAAFARDHPRADTALHRWAVATYSGEWRSTAEVVAAFSTAKTVSRDRVRFEIDGGSFRLIVAYNFRRQIAFVKFIARMRSTTASTPRRWRYSEMELALFPIRNDEDHTRALREITRFWNAPDGSPEGDYMDALATLVDAYERLRWPAQRSTPLEMLQFWMDQNDYTQSDFAKLLGSRSRASEILNGKREMTLDQIRLVSKRWRIPVALLVGELEEA